MLKCNESTFVTSFAASSDPRISLSLVAGHIYPSSRAARQIMRIIKLQLHKEGYTWDAVPQEARDFYWEEFQAWEDPAFKRKRICRVGMSHSETGGDGARPSRHTGGSISAIETARLLAKELGREPNPIEVFTYTHTKDHDLNTFVDRRAVSVNGGEKQRKVYGIGSETSQFYCGSAAHASTASAGPQPEHTAEEFTELRARADDQQRQIAKLKAHVMRLSGEPGAGTSSSDPVPATDRNVSTSQQQPLPSPDPDAADNTLVTPPGTTVHPVGTPPSDSTSDRADEQPRRFDFGPF
ncbi:hypothetical protein JCGZ_23033 [Jatropha curcas]|uniref:Uncharacterized protein n=1 Tax=Jatropha curcas TaxID=180498 RepID=A0A067LGY6_JATCU|nr:hypothetical protein JCGZ_23033 [Jatropha curcas]